MFRICRLERPESASRRRKAESQLPPQTRSLEARLPTLETGRSVVIDIAARYGSNAESPLHRGESLVPVVHVENHECRVARSEPKATSEQPSRPHARRSVKTERRLGCRFRYRTITPFIRAGGGHLRESPGSYRENIGMPKSLRVVRNRYDGRMRANDGCVIKIGRRKHL